MTIEEAIKILKAIRVYECYPKSASEETKEALDMVIGVLSESNVHNLHNGDLISRKDAIEAMRLETGKQGLLGRGDILDIIFALPSAEAVSREFYVDAVKANIRILMENRELKEQIEPAEAEWIPVSEKLPEEETDVLVTRTFLGCKDGSRGWNSHIPPSTYVEVAQYFNGEWTALSDEYKVARNRHTEPIAWMPLPKPYRKDGEA